MLDASLQARSWSQQTRRNIGTHLQVLLNELLNKGGACSSSQGVSGNVVDTLLAFLGALSVLLQADEVVPALGGGESQELSKLLPADRCEAVNGQGSLESSLIQFDMWS